ncbi:MAG: transglutaminase-like cysteine peptidase [Desulfovibrio sp.]|uniref:transglutaminase-like cysteine peptidase n=1 Tax=Desulfovibrio sp. TaxID=885 RepID=UPI0039E655C9
MKTNRLLRFSLLTALPLAVVFLLVVLTGRYFLPLTATAAQNVATGIVAGGLVGDDYAPDRPLSTTLDKVDQIQPSSLEGFVRQPPAQVSTKQQKAGPEKKSTPSNQGGIGQPDENPVVLQVTEDTALLDDDNASPQSQGNATQEDEGDDVVPASHDKIDVPTATPASATNSSDFSKAQVGASGNKVQLFGTVEFKRPLSSLPGWLTLLKRNAKDPIFIPGKYFKKNVTWDNFKEKAKGKNPMDLLRYVNSFWNTWPYKEDIVNWGVEDYWAIPAEFLKKSGDCEDYAIVKYFTLKELGIPSENMRIVVVRDTVRNLAHAVLAVYLNGDAYILDNLSNAVLPHSRIRQYSPQYSVNEVGRWAHLKGRKVK